MGGQDKLVVWYEVVSVRFIYMLIGEEAAEPVRGRIGLHTSGLLCTVMPLILLTRCLGGI